MDLEPQGRLRLQVELKWAAQGMCSILDSICFGLNHPYFPIQCFILLYLSFFFRTPNSKTAGVQGAAGIQPQARCYAKACASIQWTQVYGNFSAATNILLTLPRLYLVWCYRTFSVVASSSELLSHLINFHSRGIGKQGYQCQGRL